MLFVFSPSCDITFFIEFDCYYGGFICIVKVKLWFDTDCLLMNRETLVFLLWKRMLYFKQSLGKLHFFLGKRPINYTIEFFLKSFILLWSVHLIIILTVHK